MEACSYPKRDLFIRIGLKYPCAGYYLRWYYNGWHYWHFKPGEQNIITEGENYRTLGKKKIIIGTGNITLIQVTAIRTILLTNEIQIYTEVGWVNVFVDPSLMVIYDNEVNGYEVEIAITIGSKEISYLSGYSPVIYVPVVPATPDPAICEVIIGTQIWMCKNYASNFPGSKSYNNSEDYRTAYGGLYTWDQIMTPGFCPTDWRVPSLNDWMVLAAYLSGELTAGGKLKEIGTDHWNAPNTGATDEVGFTALGGGYWDYATSSFLSNKNMGIFWTATENSGTTAKCVLLQYNSAVLNYYNYNKLFGFSVRLIKNNFALYDLDMNGYTTVIIGSQEWIVENFRCTKYADGTNIPNLSNAVDWVNDTQGAYCAYNNDNDNIPAYGLLYNFHAVDNVKGLAYLHRNGIQETGWRIPTVGDLRELRSHLVDDSTAGGKLKEIDTDHWNAPNTGATDEYGFKARGGGMRNILGVFQEILVKTQYWCDTKWGEIYSYIFHLLYNNAALTKDFSRKTNGFSIRLVRSVIIPETYEDWFLPSILELNAMYNNLHYLHGVGGFVSANYWSSSEDTDINALYQLFTTGGLFSRAKTEIARVRACRSFTDDIGAYSLRDTGPAGGLIFYINGTTFYEAAPSDQHAGIVWSNITNVFIGTTGQAIGTGKQNTLDIVGQAGHTNSAARWCNNLAI